LRSSRLRGLAAPLFIVALGCGGSGSDRVPLFTQYASEDPALRSYSVPVHIDASIHKLFTFHFGANGTMYFKRPGRLALETRSVPEKYRRIFADLGTPRTWPLTYDLQVLANDGTTYHIRGTPRTPCDVDYLEADVGPSSVPVKAWWHLHDGTTIASTIESSSVGNYLVPKVEHAEIVTGGFKIHADLEFGDYEVNGQISENVF